MANNDPTQGIISGDGLKVLSDVLLTRYQLFNRMAGIQFGGKRDVITAAGLPKILTFDNFWTMFDRFGVAKRVVTMCSEAAWKTAPVVYEKERSAQKKTAFEQAWADLCKRLNVYYYLKELDRQCGIGQYGCLFFGLDDNQQPEVPVAEGSKPKIAYMRIFNQGNATIDRLETEATNKRYGRPTFYKLSSNRYINGDTSMSNAGTQGPQAMSQLQDLRCHYTRMLHVVPDLPSEATFGTSRLHDIYNELESLMKIIYSSAENYWQNCIPGMNFNADKDIVLDDAMKQRMKDQIELYMMGLQRYITTQGVEAKTLTAQLSDPKSFVDVLLMIISLVRGIPKRLLIGTEEAQLASTQDRENWRGKVEDYQNTFVEPQIIRPFVDQLIAWEVLPAPKERDGYKVYFPSSSVMTIRERSEVANTVTTALGNYVNQGVYQIMPLDFYLEELIGLPAETVEKLMKEIGLDEGDDHAKAAEELKKRLSGQSAPAPEAVPGEGGNQNEPQPVQKPTKPGDQAQ